MLTQVSKEKYATSCNICEIYRIMRVQIPRIQSHSKPPTSYLLLPMPRSLIIIPLTLFITAVWASSTLFPDRSDMGFPALPTTPGTLGHALTTYFDTDGNALTGRALDGVTATGYLRGTSCPAGETWRGIDAQSGRAICKWPPLAFAVIYEGTMRVNGANMPVGTILREWDRIETTGSQTGTIRFNDDLSIARLGTNTAILLDRGNTTGTIAQVILDNGLLWWRVLTSNDINFGGGGVVAWIRGTSVAIEKTDTGMVYFTIPHSIREWTNISNAAARISTTHAITPGGAIRALPVRWSVQFNSGSITTISSLSIVNRTLNDLYNTWRPMTLSPWIAYNTLLDIWYMRQLSPATQIINEISVTIPTKWTSNDPCLITRNSVWYSEDLWCVSAYADASTNYDLRWADRTWEALAVRDITNTEWDYDSSGRHPSFRDGNWIGYNNNNTDGWSPFNNSASWSYKYSNLFGWILAVWYPTDTSHYNNWYGWICNPLGWITRIYCWLVLSHHETSRTSPRDLYQAVWVRTTQPTSYYASRRNFWNDSGHYSMVRFISGYQRNDIVGGTTYNINTWTLNIDRAGKYLTYVGDRSQLEYYLTGGNLAPGFNYSSLAGKTITIEVNTMPTTLNMTLLDFWWGMRIRKTASGYQCTWLWDSDCVTINSANRTLTFPTPTDATTNFVIGNNISPISGNQFNTPIGVSINKIIISN